MPHSGGGGSHGGGSHHSSHSSHRSSGGHHSSGHSSSGPRISSKPFTGSHTYVIYDKTGTSRLLYSSSANYNGSFSLGEFILKILFSLAFVLPGFIAVVISIIAGFKCVSFGLTKTKYSGSIDDEIYIYDDYDLISEKEEESLKKVFEQFRDKTGIIPSVEFTNEDQWRNNYTDMEAFAYNEYVDHFYDEYHLLVVYSTGYHDEDTGFNEFYYHTMWGDNLSKTAKAKDEDAFLDILATELARANGSNLGKAFENTFTTFYQKLSSKGISFDSDKLFLTVFLFFWGAIFGGCGLAVFIPTIKEALVLRKDGEKMYKVSDIRRKAECAYCGCSYYLDTVGNCPSCNAPLPAQPVGAESYSTE